MCLRRVARVVIFLQFIDTCRCNVVVDIVVAVVLSAAAAGLTAFVCFESFLVELVAGQHVDVIRGAAETDSSHGAVSNPLYILRLGCFCC